MSYKIKKKVPKKKYYSVYINADSNDGDYISTTTDYSQEEFDEIVDELINLKNNYCTNHLLSKYPNEMDLNIPCSDWGRCHSLAEVEVILYDIDGFIYEVELINEK